VAARTQQSLIKPIVAAVAEAATSPDPGVTGAVLESSLTGAFMRWTGAMWTAMVPAGGGGNAVQATVDFGYASGGEDSLATVTVTASWVSATSKIVCSPAASGTADHDPQDAAAEMLSAYATNLVAGVGFDIVAAAPGGTWGRYLINAVGG
jgi:hypothetical protein